MRVRAILMAIACGVAAFAPAQAADQSVPAARAPSYNPNTYYPPATMWTGFYAGLHVGGVFGNGSWVDPYFDVSSNPSGSGIEGGGQIGVNEQWDWLVVGAELDAGGMNLHASTTNAGGDINTIESTWMFTVTGRVGYAVGPWLLYAKGGAAFADVRNNVPTQGVTGISVVQPGWTVGAGVEYALTHNWSARLEYDYMDFSHISTGIQPPPPNPVGNLDWTIQRVVGAVNYRF
jgi:outer membrane immunogenic protein